MATIKKACKGVSYPKSSSVSKRLGSPSKAKNGKSFPDLNKDGKITKADILKGRGVIAKKGMKVKKAKEGDETPFQMYAKKTGRTDTLPGNDSRRSFGFDRGTPIRKAKEAAFDATYGKGNAADDEARVPFTKAGKKSLAKTLSGLKKGGSVKKSASKKSMKMGGKMTKKCMYGCK